MKMKCESDRQNIPNAPVVPPNGLQFIGRPDIQTLFIDKFVFTKRQDGTVITSGIQGIPGVEIEQLRFLMTEDHAKKFLDSLSKLLDYYPIKGKAPETQIKSKPEASSVDKEVATKTRKPSVKKKQASK